MRKSRNTSCSCEKENFDINSFVNFYIFSQQATSCFILSIMTRMDLLKTIFRVAQPTFGFIAMVCVGAAFPERETFGGSTVQLTTHTFNFLLLMNYTSFLTMTAYVVAINVLRVASEPKILVRGVMDLMSFFLLFCGAIAGATSNITEECTQFSIFVRCSTIHAAVIFSFFGAVAFLVTLGITAMEYKQQTRPSPSSLPHYDDATTPQNE